MSTFVQPQAPEVILVPDFLPEDWDQYEIEIDSTKGTYTNGPIPYEEALRLEGMVKMVVSRQEILELYNDDGTIVASLKAQDIKGVDIRPLGSK